MNEIWNQIATESILKNTHGATGKKSSLDFSL